MFRVLERRLLYTDDCLMLGQAAKSASAHESADADPEHARPRAEHEHRRPDDDRGENRPTGERRRKRRDSHADHDDRKSAQLAGTVPAEDRETDHHSGTDEGAEDGGVLERRDRPRDAVAPARVVPQVPSGSPLDDGHACLQGAGEQEDAHHPHGRERRGGAVHDEVVDDGADRNRDEHGLEGAGRARDGQRGRMSRPSR